MVFMRLEYIYWASSVISFKFNQRFPRPVSQRLYFRGITADLINTASPLLFLRGLLSSHQRGKSYLRQDIRAPWSNGTNVRLRCQSRNKKTGCAAVREPIDPRRAVGILPARSEAPIATCMRPENKGPGPPLWQPSPSACRLITSRLSRNKWECRQTPAKKKTKKQSLCAGCRSPVGHGCIYNFMRVHFQIDSSLMPGSGFVMEWNFKWWKMETLPVAGVIRATVEIFIGGACGGL